jgi:hypothetical protein
MVRSQTRPPPRFTQFEPYAGEFERRRPAFQRGDWGSERRALLGFPEGLARQDNPQIRVLPPLREPKPTSIDRLPLVRKLIVLELVGLELVGLELVGAIHELPLPIYAGACSISIIFNCAASASTEAVPGTGRIQNRCSLIASINAVAKPPISDTSRLAITPN